MSRPAARAPPGPPSLHGEDPGEHRARQEELGGNLARGVLRLPHLHHRRDHERPGEHGDERARRPAGGQDDAPHRADREHGVHVEQGPRPAEVVGGREQGRVLVVELPGHLAGVAAVVPQAGEAPGGVDRRGDAVLEHVVVDVHVAVAGDGDAVQHVDAGILVVPRVVEPGQERTTRPWPRPRPPGGRGRARSNRTRGRRSTASRTPPRTATVAIPRPTDARPSCRPSWARARDHVATAPTKTTPATVRNSPRVSSGSPSSGVPVAGVPDASVSTDGVELTEGAEVEVIGLC